MNVDMAGAALPATRWLPPSAATRILDRVALGVEIVVVAAISADLLLTVAGATMRFAFAIPLFWSGDLSMLLLNVVVFLGAAAAFRRRLDLRFTFLVELGSARQRAICQAASYWLVALLAAIVLAAFPSYAASLATHGMVALPLTQLWAALPMGIGYALLLVYALEAVLAFPARAILGGCFVAAFGAVAVYAFTSWQTDAWPDPLWPALGVLALAFMLGVPIAFTIGLSGVALSLMNGGNVMLDLPAAFQQGVSNYVLQAIPFFMIAGVLMTVTGMARRLVTMMAAWVGHWPAGLLITQVAAMYVFSGLSGSKTADVAAIGAVMSQELKNRGYSPAESVATLAAAGAMGETIPPSIGILVLASVSSLSIGTLFLAGMLPALVLAVVLIGGILIRNRGRRVPAPVPFDLRTALRQTAAAMPALAMPAVLVGGIVFALGTPTEISAFAVLYGALVSLLVYRSIAGGPLWIILRDAALLSGTVLLIISTASMLSESITFDGLPVRLVQSLAAQGPAVFWTASAIGLVIAGSVLEGLGGLMIFAPILMPLAAPHGINPIHYGIVLLVAMGIGSFAPPIGVGLYIACAAGGARIHEAMRPSAFYTMVLLAGLLLLILVPDITMAVPRWAGMAK
ncbi:MAG TPA: TRAP transporter large permease subunit [Devosiaceae bacterium]